jgi:hypothetical protein
MAGPPDPQPKLYRFDFTEDELKEFKDERSLQVDAETYMRWLETGDGPDPCEAVLSQ